MKNKLGSALITLSLGSMLFSQLAFATQSGDSPISSPISAPIPSPISGPIMTPIPTPTVQPSATPSASPTASPSATPTPKPISTHSVSGQGWYVSFGSNGFSWKHSAAANVLIELRNTENNKYYSTRTDNKGFYRLTVEDGNYNITISDNFKSTFANPPVSVFVNRNVSGVNFMGVLIPSVKQFSVTGQVNYYNYLFQNGKWVTKYVGARGVAVEMRNTITGEVVRGTTDYYGAFNLKIGPGYVLVRVSDPRNNVIFAPFPRAIYVTGDTSAMTFNARAYAMR